MRPIILNVPQLCKDIAYYANMFPTAKPVTYDDLEKSIENDYDRSFEGCGFGYSVSPAREDKCFCFVVKVKTDNSYIVEYTGVCKC